MHGDPMYDFAQQQHHQQQLGGGNGQLGHGAHGQDPYFGAQHGGMGHFVRQPVSSSSASFRSRPLTVLSHSLPQLQYHLYHPLPSSLSHNSHPPTHPSFFLPPSLHISLTAKSEATHATPSVDMKLPEEVGGYTGLMPLDKGAPMGSEGPAGQGGGWAGYRSWVYKAWKEADGKAYALRRIEGGRAEP